MPHRECCHGMGGGCACEMGNIYRFTEPIVLLSLVRLGEAHGYQIAQQANELAVTPAGLDAAAVYRTLRRLEDFGHVVSEWDTASPGPARRNYRITESGLNHLRQWSGFLEEFMAAIGIVLNECRSVLGAESPKD